MATKASFHEKVSGSLISNSTRLKCA